MGNMAESTEKLVRRAKKGDQEAFIALMESQKLSMSRIALSILHNEEDAADAIGETVLAAFSQLCTLREPRFFKTWLTRVLIRNCCDLLRGHRCTAPMEGLGEVAAESPDYDRAMDVRQSLSQLAENDRLVLTLHYMDGLRIREIASLLDVKEGTVKTRLMRSRQRFKKIYLGQEGDCT